MKHGTQKQEYLVMFLKKNMSKGNFEDIDTGIGKKSIFCLKQRCSHYKFSDPPILEEPSSAFIMMNHFLTSEHSLARSQTRCIFQGLGTWTHQQHHILVEEKKDIPGNTPLKINVVRKGRAFAT